jgi:uroporphyrinogen-III synthase
MAQSAAPGEGRRESAQPLRLIVTRPEPEASRTARALIRLGHTAILSPALEVVLDSKASIPVRPYQAVLVTSNNGVRALASRPVRPVAVDTPLLAVGDQTALEAKRAGFSAARSAGGTLDDLVALVVETLSPSAGPLLYAAGKTQSGDLAGALAAHGFEVETAVIYRAEPLRRLANVARDALTAGAVDGVLFYSRRSAAAFALGLRAGKLAPLASEVTCFCLSQAVAEAVRPVTRGKVLVAERPDQIALFALIESEAAARSAAAGG